MPAGEGRLSSHATGEIELDGKVLVIRKIHVRYQLKADAKGRDIAERVLGIHADSCPVARTLKGCVALSTSLDIVED